MAGPADEELTSCRAVRKYQSKGIMVSKLVRNPPVARVLVSTDRLQFAKHIKLEEATKFLEEHRTGIAVGTPTRLNDLVENSKTVCPIQCLV